MKSQSLHTLALLVVCLAPQASAAVAGDPPPFVTSAGDSYEIALQENEATLEQLLAFVEEALALELDTLDSEVTGVLIQSLRPRTVKKDELWSFTQQILLGRGFLVFPVAAAGEGAGGRRFLVRSLANAMSSGVFFRSQAPVLAADSLDELGSNPALVVTTVFTLEHVSAIEIANLLQAFAPNATYEYVRAVAGGNRLCVSSILPTVIAIRDLVRKLDEPPVDDRTLELVPLAFAPAGDVAQILERLLNEPQAQPGAPASSLVAARQPPRIEVDPRTNALLVYARPDDQQRIMAMIQELDVQVQPGADAPR